MPYDATTGSLIEKRTVRKVLSDAAAVLASRNTSEREKLEARLVLEQFRPPTP